MISRLFLLAIACVTTITATGADPGPGRVVVSVRRNYDVPNLEKVQLVFDWQELSKRIPSLTAANIKVTDQHFGGVLPVLLADENGDQKADKVSFEYTFKSTEPVFAFLVTNDGKNPPAPLSQKTVADGRMSLEYLMPFDAKAMKAKSVAAGIVDATLHTYPDVKDLSIISPGKWTYEYGYFLNATFKLWETTKDARYLDYIKRWVNNFINDDGTWKEGVYNRKEYRLDDILPGRLCIFLYQQTGEAKYKKVVDQLIEHLKEQPKTSEGGYWHKEIYPNQMWLDGIYMGDLFSMQYAAAFKDSHWFDEASLQIKLIYSHTYDPATGLLFHGWDESKNKVWADQKTGHSPELWSRAIGWYAIALVECLDYLPADHPERKNIEVIFQKLCESIKRFTDKKTGLWFQVINKGDLGDNWIETSASAMFTYAFAKGSHRGFLDKSYLDASGKALESLLSNYVYVDARGDLHLDQAVKVGSLNIKNSKGDYPYYISCERRLDDYKGLAALLYAAMELNK